MSIPMDVFATRFGLLSAVVENHSHDSYPFLQIMTGNVPFYTVKNHYSIPMLVVAGNRPPKLDRTDPAHREYGLTDQIWSFIEACWKQDPKSRLTAAEVEQNDLFSSLADHRPAQDWGETSAAEFRRLVVSS